MKVLVHHSRTAPVLTKCDNFASPDTSESDYRIPRACSRRIAGRKHKVKSHVIPRSVQGEAHCLAGAKQGVDIIVLQSLLFTVNDLLELARLDSGSTTQVTADFDLPKLLRETVGPYQDDAVKKGLEFIVITNACPRLITGDSRKISCVVANLTANAGELPDLYTTVVQGTEPKRSQIHRDRMRDRRVQALSGTT